MLSVEKKITSFSSKKGIDDFLLRTPNLSDGPCIAEMVRESGILDTNSTYLYLLLCKDFAQTCIVAESRDKLLGFVTGYIPPFKKDTYFLWQVAVQEEARGAGLAALMICGLLRNLKPLGITKIETTVTPSNTSSLRLFEKLARELNTKIKRTEGFPAHLFQDGHEAEYQYTIGPF